LKAIGNASRAWSASRYVTAPRSQNKIPQKGSNIVSGLGCGAIKGVTTPLEWGHPKRQNCSEGSRPSLLLGPLWSLYFSYHVTELPPMVLQEAYNG
jgi:hypothetical protein